MSEPRKPEEINQEYRNKCCVFGDKVHRHKILEREIEALERDLIAYHEELEVSRKYWERKDEG